MVKEMVTRLLSRNDLQMMSPEERRRLALPSGARVPQGDFKSAKDLRYYEAVSRYWGWNPIQFVSNRVVRFRCGMCAALLMVGYRDFEQEFEVRCACGHTMVFKRNPPDYSGPRR